MAYSLPTKRLLKIRVVPEGQKVKLKFKDSLMLLPLSLIKLIKTFNIDTNKLSFPYLFIRKKEDLNYTGNIPKFEFFSDINKDEYNQLSSNFSKKQPWVFKTENSKYLYNDVKSLYEIIDIFSKEIYERERINITRIISISGLALKIYSLRRVIIMIWVNLTLKSLIILIIRILKRVTLEEE